MGFYKLKLAEQELLIEDQMPADGNPYPILVDNVLYDNQNLPRYVNTEVNEYGEVVTLDVSYSNTEYRIIDVSNVLTTVGYPTILSGSGSSNIETTTIVGKFKIKNTTFTPYSRELNISTIPVNFTFQGRQYKYFNFTANREFNDSSLYLDADYREVKIGSTYPVRSGSSVTQGSAIYLTSALGTTLYSNEVIDFGDNTQEVPKSFYDWIYSNFELVLDEDYDGIVFYNSTSSKNRVDKSGFLSINNKMQGVFRDGFSLTEPVVTIEYNGVPTFNYAYIKSLKRYYFVTSIKNIRNNTWEISFDVDSLMTYRRAIKKLNAFIDRSESDPDGYIIDTKRVVQQGYTYEQDVVQNKLFVNTTGYYVLNGLDTYVKTDGIIGALVPRTYPEDVPADNPTELSSTDWITDPVVGYRSRYNGCGCFEANELEDFAENFIFNPPASSLIYGDITNWLNNLIFFPFDMRETEFDFEYLNSYKLFIGIATDSNNKVKAYPMNEKVKDGFVLGQYYYEPKYNDFRDYEPYTQLQVFLPYLGLVDIPIADVIGKYIQFRLVVDFQTGDAIYIIGVNDNQLSFPNAPYRTGTDDSETRIVATYNCQIGYHIPIGTNNAAEIRRNGIMAAVNIATSLAGMFIPYSTSTTSPHTEKIVYTQKNPETKRQNIQSTMTTFEDEKTRETWQSPAYCFNASMSALSNVYSRANTDRANSSILDIINSKSIRIIRKLAKVKDVDSGYGSLYGYPCGRVQKIEDVLGYTEISSVRIEGDGFENITATEISNLQIELASGIIL